MFGLTINLLMDTQDNEVNNKSSIPNLVWSAYDRIYFQKISLFEEFFSIDDTVLQWSGSVQSLHLYSHDFYPNKIEIREHDKSRFNDILFNKNNPEEEYDIGMIVSMKANPLVFSQNDINKNRNLVEQVTSEIKKVANTEPFDFFFSLGEEDIVLIVLGNSVDKFMNIISKLRSLVFKYNAQDYLVFELTNSFLIQNCSNSNKTIECKQAYANLNIALQKGVNERVFENKLLKKLERKSIESVKPTMMVGEYDFNINLHPINDSNDIFELYSEKNKNNILNANSKFYKDFIKNSKTIWCVNTDKKIRFPKKELQLPLVSKKTKKNNYGTVNKKIKKLLINLNEKARNNHKDIPYAYYNVIYFLQEASLTLNSTSNAQWKHIVSEQINAFIDSYINYSNTIETAEHVENIEEYIIELNEVINDMRSSFYHINRSNELFYHIPTTSLHYSGSFNSILLAYYRFINEILTLAYNKPHNKNTKQAKIVYLVYFGMTSKIQQKTYLSDDNNPNETKLVGFELPYSALYDMKKYFISLIHETYHLIAPYNRQERNILLQDIWKHYFIKEEFILALEKSLSIIKDSNLDKFLIARINKFFMDNKVETTFQLNIPQLNVLSLKKLNNRIISEIDFINNYKAREFFNNLYLSFRADVMNSVDDLNRDKSLSLNDITETTDELILKLCQNDSIVGYSIEDISSYETRQNNIIMLVDNISEIICDNFMCQLSFDKYENPYYHYLKYMLDFFRERKIKYSEDDMAKMRFAMFIRTNNVNIDSLQFDDSTLSNFRDAVDHYDECYDVIVTDIINKIIQKDDFMFLVNECYNAEDYNIILNKLTNIKSRYILNVNNAFESKINIINALNVEFSITEPKTNSLFKEVSQNETQKSETDDISSKDIMTTFYARNLDDYLRIVKEVSANNSNRELWYRGICNYTYKLFPSLFVNIERLKNENPPKTVIPYCYQLALMQECYSSTKKYYETFAKNETPIAARQSLMQHYGVPTNLLDFSVDPLSAIFWALNPTAENDHNKFITAVVYIFDPYEYSEAINYIRRKKFRKSNNIENIYPIRSHDSLNDNYIIETTKDENTENVIKKYNSLIKEKRNWQDRDYKKYLYENAPIPFVVPQKNHRIIAQSGTFLAYNLLSLPGIDKTYSYLSLDSIRNDYIKVCEDNNEIPVHSDFIQRVLIAPNYLSDIKFTLNNTFHYSMDSVYPDLENLLKDIKKRTYGYNLN